MIVKYTLINLVILFFYEILNTFDIRILNENKMKTKILTLALTAIFGLGLINAQEVNKSKQEPTKKEVKATNSKPAKKKKASSKKATSATKSNDKSAKAM